MKKGTKAWMDFAHRDLESSRLLVDSEYVSNVVLFHAQQCEEKMNILDKVRQPENRKLELKRYGKIDTKLLSMLKYYNYNPGNPIHNINSLLKIHGLCWMVEHGEDNAGRC